MAKKNVTRDGCFRDAKTPSKSVRNYEDNPAKAKDADRGTISKVK